MKKFAHVVNVLFFLVVGNLSAQNHFVRFDSIPVVVKGKLLQSPWAGGLNNPQFSNIDARMNGNNDLLVYERSSDKKMVFLSSGKNSTKFIYSDSLSKRLPEMHHWVQFADYNCDGKKDLFISSNNGLQTGVCVMRNVSGSELQFSPVSSMLKADGSPIYISEWNVPCINDIDSDGDLDIMSFDVSGYLMTWFKNLSIEQYGNCDSLIFTQAEDCWGKFSEDFGNCTVSLGISCRMGEGAPKSSFHSSSSILALDLNNDRAKELVIGNVVCNKPYLLMNGGSNASAKITSYSPDFPAANPVDICCFPAIFNVDADNDGINDLIAAPNGVSISENISAVAYYKNAGTDALPVFNFQRRDFLQGEMIDVGENAYPVLFDYDHDGWADLFIGNYQYYVGANQYSSIALFKNNHNAFELVTLDFAGTSQLNTLGMHPAFGDLDGDGDEDMIVGDHNGYLHRYENIAPLNQAADFVLREPLYQSIKVGQYAAPHFADVNDDGLSDLLVGQKNGRISYFENVGSRTSAVFSLVSTEFGGVNVCAFGSITGYSNPLLTHLDDSCNFTLLVGSESGRIFKYVQEEEMNYQLADSFYNGIFEGKYSSVATGDINADGKTDMIIGNAAGGVVSYRNRTDNPVTCKTPKEKPFSIKIFPNPIQSNSSLHIDGVKPDDTFSIEIFNALGQQILSTTRNGFYAYSISFPPAPAGVYVCKIEGLPADVVKILFVR